MAEDDHAKRITDEQEVDAAVVQDAGCGIIVGGEAG
jgi:hypothetical protein